MVIDVATNDDLWPDRDLFAQCDFTDDNGRRVDPGRFVNFGVLVIISANGHTDPCDVTKPPHYFRTNTGVNDAN